MKLKNYTFLYLEGFNRYETFLLENAIEEQNVNSLFNNRTDFTDLLTSANVDQLRFIFYKIINDLPNTDVSRFLTKLIELTNTQSYSNASQEIVKRFQDNYGAYINPGNTPTISKVYKALHEKPDLNKPPKPLENFGVRTPAPGATGATGPDTGASGATGANAGASGATGPDAGASGATGPDAGGLAGQAAALGAGVTGMLSGIPSFGAPSATPPPGPGAPTNLNARGEQLRQNSTFRQGARSGGNSTRPISPQGGPTYYVRTAPGQYRPAVRADMSAKMPLYIKNPNPVGALVKPYVQVADEVARARRASPADQRSIDKEMDARGLQKIGPGGTRKEADGSVRRKSQFGGAAGSISNLFGDIGNTLKKGSR